MFDSSTHAARPFTPEALASKAGWTEVPEDQLNHNFKGDAVVVNDKVALVLRRAAVGPEVYSLGSTAPVMRAVLTPVAAAKPSVLNSFRFVENDLGGAVAEATFAASDGQKFKVRFGLKVGLPVIQTDADKNALGLRVEAQSRFVIMPDFFADDIAVDAAELPVAQADLPSDNLVLHLLPDHGAIVMTVVKTSEEDIHITLDGEGNERTIRSSEIRYGKDSRIWVAVLAGQALWHAQNVVREQAGKVVPLDWKAPFPAQWRTDWRRSDALTDSWEMLSERPDGQFAKNGIFGGPDTIPADRKRWTTVLGEFRYPCWIDKRGQGWFQPLNRPALHFEGPALIYPLSRTRATGLNDFTVIDILRDTLGIGPCEYVLDVEGQQSQYKGRATCSVRDTLNPIYSEHLQKQRRAEIEKTLQDLMIFIRHIRGRIEGYVTFGHETLAYLAEQKNAHPELAKSLGELEKAAQTIDARFEARRNKIKTPEDVAKLVEEFRGTVLDYEGADALAKCKQFTEAWVDVGGNQDELVGECRWAVKMLRQKAGLLMATDPRVTEVARELRRRTQLVLRNPAIHEGARH